MLSRIDSFFKCMESKQQDLVLTLGSLQSVACEATITRSLLWKSKEWIGLKSRVPDYNRSQRSPNAGN